MAHEEFLPPHSSEAEQFVLGAVLLTALPEALRYIGPLQQRWFGEVFIDPSDLRMLLFGLSMIVVIRLRPEGLFGSAPKRKAVHARAA